MPRTFASRVVLAPLAVYLTACSPEPTLEPDPRPDIDAARVAFREAHEQGDAGALANLVTNDALIWSPGMEEVSGREAIHALAEGMFAAMSISDFEIESRELTVHGDVACELATHSETLTHEGAEPSPVRGRHLIVWKRDADGQWRVHRNMFHFISGARARGPRRLTEPLAARVRQKPGRSQSVGDRATGEMGHRS